MHGGILIPRSKGGTYVCMYNEEGVVYGRRKVGGWEVQWEHSSCISQRKISGRIERGGWGEVTGRRVERRRKETEGVYIYISVCV